MAVYCVAWLRLFKLKGLALPICPCGKHLSPKFSGPSFFPSPFVTALCVLQVSWNIILDAMMTTGKSNRLGQWDMDTVNRWNLQTSFNQVSICT